MKRILISQTFAALVGLYSISGFAGTMGEVQGSSAFEITGGALFLKPSGAKLDYALRTQFINLPENLNYTVKSIRPDYEAGFYLGGRYIFPSANKDIQLTWSHFDQTYSDATRSTNDNEFVYPVVDPFDIFLSQGSAKIQMKYDVVNLDAAHLATYDNMLRMRFFGGLSWARLEQQLTSAFQGIDPIPVAVQYSNNSQFTGIGPRVGLLANYGQLWGFSLVGQAAGSVLFGSAKPELGFIVPGFLGPTRPGVSLNNSTEVVPALDVKLGLNFSHAFSNNAILTVEGGYMGAIYINAMTTYTPNLLAPLTEGFAIIGNLNRTTNNFAVQGPYVTGTITFA